MSDEKDMKLLALLWALTSWSAAEDAAALLEGKQEGHPAYEAYLNSAKLVQYCLIHMGLEGIEIGRFGELFEFVIQGTRCPFIPSVLRVLQQKDICHRYDIERLYTMYSGIRRW